MQLRDYQQEALERTFERWNGNGEQRTAIVLPTGAGKGHPLDTEVPTPQGLRRWGDLAVGDEVFGADGHPTTVTGVFDRGALDTYRVTMKHGEQVLADGDHLWQVQRKGRQPRVVTTRWLMAQPMKDADGYLWAVPMIQPVQRRKTVLPLDPYVVGALIANGGMTHAGTVLTTPDDRVVERVRRSVRATPLKTYSSRTCPAYILPGLVPVTRDLGLRVHSRHKRIPRQYLEAAEADRVALLHGLMDADGSVRQGGRRSVRYSTTSSGLVTDVRELVTSLGGTASTVRTDRLAEGKPVEYMVNILLPVTLAAMSSGRKVAMTHPSRRFHPRSCIIGIEPAGRSEIRCISVSAPDHLYAITRNHIITHNTVVFSHIIRQHLDTVGGQVLVLAHRDELITQAADKISEVLPTTPVGIVKAKLNQVRCQVVVASQQTLQRATRRALLPPFTLVVVDETHRVMGDSYQEIMRDLGSFDDTGPRVLGVTATFTREDSKRLTDFYESVAYSLDITELIARGYLVPPFFRRVLIEGLDLSAVAVRRQGEVGRDFAPGELDAAMERAGAPGVVAAAYVKHALNRSGLIFCPSVSSAEHVAEALRSYGVTSEALSGKTPQGVRRDIIERFKAGQLQTVTNCAVLGEGFDAPNTSCVVIARPTCSKILFRQQVGRGLRLHPGKDDCLVLDVVGATGRNDLKTLNDITDRPLDVHEGETVTQAIEREASEREVLVGDAQISGSLDAIDVDPWTVELMRGRPRKVDGTVLTEEELAEIAAERERERLERQQEKERREKRRYKHVPMRSGWFLVTPNGRQFIQIETGAGQTGFVVVVADDSGGHHVGWRLPGTTSRVLASFDTEAEATRYAVNAILYVVSTAMERYVVDPDARWRRQPATTKAIDFADQLVQGVDFDEYHYRGQVSDMITWGRMHRDVDNFADSIAREAKSGTLAAATT